MAERPGSNSSHISIGGNVEGSAVAAGHGNVQTVTVHAPIEQQADLRQALLEIRNALTALSGPDAEHAKRTVDDAIDASSAKKPSVDAVGHFLDAGLRAAKRTAEFASIAAQLATPVERVTQWLGGEWGHLLNLT